MIHINLNIIDKFFDAYSRKDINNIKQVLSENVKWTFPGQNKFSGTKVGINEVVDFFDKIGDVMGKSNAKVEKLVVGENDDYVLECQRIITDSEDNNNIDQQMCVLWMFKDGKIVEGKHFTEDQINSDVFYNKIWQVK